MNTTAKLLKPALTAVPDTCRCATCEKKLPVLSSVARLRIEAGTWHALAYCCEACGAGEDYVLVKPPAPITCPDDEIALIVQRIRQHQTDAEETAARIRAEKERLTVLLAERGSAWSDESGYARLSSGGTRISYDTDGLDAQIIAEPVRYQWLKDYRKESAVRGSVTVK